MAITVYEDYKLSCGYQPDEKEELKNFQVPSNDKVQNESGKFDPFTPKSGKSNKWVRVKEQADKETIESDIDGEDIASQILPRQGSVSPQKLPDLGFVNEKVEETDVDLNEFMGPLYLTTYH
jgi:hypothetical protein